MRKYTKEEIEKVINESPDMITALEAVGAMYAIPSTHIIGQPGLKSIRVENDMIIAPSDVKPNTKSVVCAIGAVLDQISQRINDKLNDFQTTNIEKGRIEEKIAQTANPNKGNVVSHYTMSDGSEIIVYDSGLIDMPHTDEARAKVAQLRASGELPEVNIFNDNKEYTPSPYFSKDDDIGLTDQEKKELFGNDPIPTNIANITNESDMHLEMCSHYRDTDNLGFDVFSEMGFDFIRATESFISEAAKSKSDKLKNANISHAKFDNTEITKAIKCFNEARMEQKNVGKGEFNVKTFINSPKYKEAVNHLAKQFDCALSVYWHIDNEEPSNRLFTYSFDMIAQNLYVSKSKGFQLNGLPIQIHVINKSIDEEMTKDANIKLFGQFVCAGLCHEIFHNIANALRMNNGVFAFTLESAMNLAASTTNAKRKREIFERYAATLTNGKNGPISKLQKKKLVTYLCKASAISENNKNLRELKDSVKISQSATQEIDTLISKYKKRLDELQPVHNKLMKKGAKYDKSKATAMTVIGIILTCLVVTLPIGIVMLANTGSIEHEYYEKFNNYMRTKNKEEFYCDLFAGMYNVPVTFTYGYKNRDFTANMIDTARLQELATLEGKLYNLVMSQYPTLSERNYAGYTIAKNILEGKIKVSKEVREYCAWVVANYSNIDETDIGTNYRSHTFNPKEAEDLDKHIQNLINNNGINVTEYFSR